MSARTKGMGGGAVDIGIINGPLLIVQALVVSYNSCGSNRIPYGFTHKILNHFNFPTKHFILLS